MVYERRFGRLQAHSFSYSGNPQGCDHAIRHLHAALENLQAKLSRQPGAESAGTASAAPASPGAMGAMPASTSGSVPYRYNAAPAVPAYPGRQPAMPATSPAGAVIPLTPADSGH